MKKTVIAVACSLLTVACADRMQRVAPSQDFTIEGRDYVMISGLVSPLAAKLAGQFAGRDMRERLGLADPGVAVSERLAARLQPGLAFEVRTVAWGLRDDQVLYRARARLVAASGSGPSRELTCDASSGAQREPEASRAALVANNGELLKSKMAKAAAACADQLVALSQEAS